MVKLKTILLAEAMKGQGLLAALDPNPERVARLRENLSRTGLLPWVQALSADVTTERDGWLRQLNPPLRQGFDAILLDVPCSNTGVIRRRPDARWSFSARKLAHLLHTQARLLDCSVDLLRPGGRIVYSTGSIEPEENRDMVQSFLARTPGFILVADRHLCPPDSGTDGCYAALLRKQAGT